MCNIQTHTHAHTHTQLGIVHTTTSKVLTIPPETPCIFIFQVMQSLHAYTSM
jgi:hypothetical protein